MCRRFNFLITNACLCEKFENDGGLFGRSIALLNYVAFFMLKNFI